MVEIVRKNKINCPRCGNTLKGKKTDFPTWVEIIIEGSFGLFGYSGFQENELKCPSCNLEGKQTISLAGSIMRLFICIAPIALALVFAIRFELTFVMGTLMFIGFLGLAAITMHMFMPLFIQFETLDK